MAETQSSRTDEKIESRHLKGLKKKFKRVELKRFKVLKLNIV